MPPFEALDQDQPIDAASLLADVLEVVESLSGSLGRIDPSTVPAATIVSIVDHLGRLAAHAVSL